MSNRKLIDPQFESQKLLQMPTAQAEVLFQSYTTEQQLDIISSTRDPKSREGLYYLVPDCTSLIQMSATEDVLQVLDANLGTGLASVLLPSLSSEQFEEMMDLVLWRNGKLDEKTLDFWLFELSECEADELGRLLTQIDIGIIASLLRGRVEVSSDFKALFIEEGLIEPSSEGVEYTDERAKAIMNAIWEADQDLFIRVLYELFGLDREDELGEELWGSLERAKAEQEERVQERDRAAGINVTEGEVLEKVDLENLELEDDEDDGSAKETENV
ncbi:MAG: DUF6178 family protein [Candidatus Poribacteria bacterium]|nr:DUF6178 family protein [Candidatus Poribacteria bacterium]